MAKRPQFEIKMICSDCGKTSEPTKQGNWAVYQTTCPDCGGKVKPELKE